MNPDRDDIVILTAILLFISCIYMIQTFRFVKAGEIRLLNLRISSAFAQTLPQDRWLNNSPLSAFNPACIPIDLSPQKKNRLDMRNRLIVANQILSIHELFHDWGGPFSPRDKNRALISGETELAFGRDGWRMSYLRRIELFLRANRGLVELAWYDKNEAPLPLDHTFPLHLEGEGFEAHGLKFAHGRRFTYMGEKEIGLGFALSLLRGIRMQKAIVQGEAQVLGSKDYDYFGALYYYYNHNYLYDRENIDIGNGNGISFDIGLGLDITPQLSGSVLFHDIWGRIWWEDVPFTDAQFDSHNKEYDENGYVKYNPSISGRELKVDFTQRILPKTNLSFNYHKEEWAFVIFADFIKGDIYPNALLKYNLSDSLTLDCGYDLFFHQIHIAAKYQRFLLGISFDRVEPEKAGAFSLALDFGFNF
ncbi:MAG: hypothetical protein ACMUIM_04270 [bacterium]